MGRRKPKRPSLSSTGNPHFCTPPWILEVVRRIDERGQIALDPCSNADSVVDALVEWRGPRRGKAARGLWVDGLKESWVAAAYRAVARQKRVPLVYVNPPFSRGVVEQWMAKCDAESARGGGDISPLRPLHTVALIPGRFSASWYKRFCFPGSGRADAVCQLGRRVRFLGAPTPCPWEMSLVYWGPEPEWFARQTRKIGAVYFRRPGPSSIAVLFYAQTGPDSCPHGAAPGDCPVVTCAAHCAVS